MLGLLIRDKLNLEHFVVLRLCCPVVVTVTRKGNVLNYIYMHICIYIYIYIYVYIRIYVYMYICIYVYMYICTSFKPHNDIYIYIYILYMKNTSLYI